MIPVQKEKKEQQSLSEIKALLNKFVFEKLNNRRLENYPQIICQKCRRVPHLQIDETAPEKIKTFCSCSFDQTFLLKEFVEHLTEESGELLKEQKMKSQIETSNCLCGDCTQKFKDEKIPHRSKNKICSKHFYSISHFCYSCNEHICFKCTQEQHEDHQKIKLEDYFPQGNSEKIKKKIELAEDYINVCQYNLKETYIQYLEKKITEIEEAYKRNVEKNKDIITLSKILYDNYESFPQNFYAITNLINNTQFNLESDQLGHNLEHAKVGLIHTENVISYFNNYCVLDLNHVDLNHKLNEIKVIKTQSPIFSILITHDGRIASSSWDMSIKVYDAKTYNCEIIINKQDAFTTYLSQLDNGIMLCLRENNSIKLWNIEGKDYHQIATITYIHNDTTNKIISLPDNRFATCSQDSTIKVWNAEYPYSVISTLKGHQKEVISILHVGNTIASISFDKTLRFWDVNNYKCDEKKIIKGVVCESVNSFKQIDNERIIIGQNYITVVNIKTYQIELTIMNQLLGKINSFGVLRNGSILCGCGEMGNGKLYEMSKETYEGKAMLQKVHPHFVADIVSIDERTFATCSGWAIKVFSY